MQSDDYKDPLLQQLERFLSEVLQQIFERRFFSKNFGSHYTLFQFRLLLHEQNYDRFIREATEAFIQGSQLREKIRIQWNLYRDYDEAVRHRSEFHSNWQQKDDLATSTLTTCGACFYFLLDRQAILTSYYTIHGLSFFTLASCFKNKDIACRLISLMEPEQLLCPKSVGHWETIFQSTVVCNKMFEACWARLESDPDLDISSTLKPKHLYSVCKYASVGLARRMLDRGLDISIGLAAGGGNFTAWNAVAEFHLNPEPRSVDHSSNCFSIPVPSLRHDCETAIAASPNESESIHSASALGKKLVFRPTGESQDSSIWPILNAPSRFDSDIESSHTAFIT